MKTLDATEELMANNDGFPEAAEWALGEAIPVEQDPTAHY